MSRIGSNSIESVIDNTGLSRNRQNLGSCLKKRVSDSLLDFRIRLGMNLTVFLCYKFLTQNV